MKPFLILISILLINPNSFAQSVSDIQDDIDKLKSVKINLENKIKELKKSTDLFEDRVASALNTASSSIVRFLGGDDTPLKVESEQIRRIQEYNKKSLLEATKELESINDKILQLEKTRTDQSKFNLEIQSLKLEYQFERLNRINGDIGHKLDMMEQKFDTTILGAYIQEKIGLLVNSNIICEARNRCVTKNPAEVSNQRIQEVLFPGSKLTGERKYRDKAYGRDPKFKENTSQ